LRSRQLDLRAQVSRRIHGLRTGTAFDNPSSGFQAGREELGSRRAGRSRHGLGVPERAPVEGYSRPVEPSRRIEAGLSRR